MTFQHFKNLLTQGAFACSLLIVMMPLQATTYTVTSTADQYPIGNPGTLRWAIQQVNAGSGGDTIVFDIPTSGPGYDPVTNIWTIQPVQDLDSITQQVTIDGYSQPGSAANTLSVGSNAVLTIVLNGNNYLTGDGVTTGNGLHFLPGSDGSVVRGLVINQWLDNGILVDSGTDPLITLSNISIVGCFIGTDANGTQEMANRTGIGISGNISTCINTSIGVLSDGTSSPGYLNIIVGSFSIAVLDSYGIEGGCISSFANVGNNVQNNYIGTDRTGTKALGNTKIALQLRFDFADTVVGNLISGSSVYGIRLRSCSQGLVQGNYIGTDSSGTKPLGNVNAGIEIDGSFLDIGGITGNSILNNLISGNGAGIHIGQIIDAGAILNTVQGNFIGTDLTGTQALPNTRYGLEINKGQNTIGGSELTQTNIISGNVKGGVLIYSVNGTGNVVGGNLVGTDSAGRLSLPNNGNGIQIGLNGGLGGASGNLIGAAPSLIGLGRSTFDLGSFKKAKAKIKQRQSRRMPKRRKPQGTMPVASQSPLGFSLPQIDKTMKQLLFQPAQTIGLNFTAAVESNVLNPIVTPPNLNGWVGPQQYILMCYGIIRSFDKATGQPDGVLNIDASSFFGVDANDVRINYSRFLDRWLFSCENIDPALGYATEILVAWSDSGVIIPETVWTMSVVSNAELVPQNASGLPAVVDYNQLATDVNAVYISLDSFDATTGNFFGTSTLVIPNSSIITGNTSPAFTVFPGILPGLNPASFGTLTPPADNFDANAQFGYLIHADNFEYPSGFTYNQLSFYRILNPGSAVPTLGQEIALDVPSYADPANAPHKGNLYTLNLGGVNGMYLQTGIGSGLTAPHVRNKQLYVCHNIQVDNAGNGTPSGDRVGVRWYQFDLTGDPTGNGCGAETETTCPALVQWGTLFDSAGDTPKFYYIPAIMTNKNGDLVIEGTVSGTNDFTNVFYAGRKATDPLGSLRDPFLVTNNTSNPYNFGPLNDPTNGNIGQLWGDLSSLAPDPSNDLIIWGTGEWAAIKNGWGIQATQLLPAK